PARERVPDHVVGAPLRRPRRRPGARHVRGRHRAVGPARSPPARAALAPAGGGRPPPAVLRRRHRSRLPARCLATPDRREPGPRLSRDQDEGRAPVARGRRRQGSRDARPSRPGVPADGRRQHALERRRGAPPRAGPGPPRAAAGATPAPRPPADCAPAWLEDPTIPDDVPGHVRIVREGGLPIAAGENLHTVYEFRQLIAAGGVTFPEPDVTNCGGVTAFMKVCHLAEAFNLPVTSHGAHDLTVHLLAAVPNR